MEKGYLILPRSFFDSIVWQQKHVYSDAEAWLDIVRSARYDNKPCTADIHKKAVTWTHGEWPVSMRFLADRWQWSMRRVRTFLKILSDHRLITIRKSQVMNIIQVNDFNQYCGTANSTVNDTANGTVPNAVEGTAKEYHKPQIINDLHSGQSAPSAQQNVCEQHLSGTANDTPNDTANGTKKNKDINISINNINRAREDEKSIQDEIHEMAENESWKEAICMRHHISPQQLARYLRMFAADCICCGRPAHNNMADAFSHFHHWLRIQLQQQNSSSDNNSKSNNNASKTSRPTSADFIREAQQWAISQSQDLICQAALRHRDIQETLSL